MFHRDFVSGRVGAVKRSTVNLMLYDGFCIAVFRLFPVGTGSESGKSIVRNPLRILLFRHRCPGIFWGCFGCLLLMLRTSFEDASDAFFGCFGCPLRFVCSSRCGCRLLFPSRAVPVWAVPRVFRSASRRLWRSEREDEDVFAVFCRDGHLHGVCPASEDGVVDVRRATCDDLFPVILPVVVGIMQQSEFQCLCL